MALPTALLATTASLALGGAAVMSSVDVQSSSKRDSGSKSAIAAADAGANVAMQRLNRYGGTLSSEDPCLNLNAEEELEAGPAPVGEPDWCAPIEDEVGSATYSYRVNALGSNCGSQDVCIVSTGTASEVSRRIELSLDEASLAIGLSEEDIKKEELRFAEESEASEAEIKKLKEELAQAEEENLHAGGVAGLVGRESITASGNSNIRVGVGTDGDLTTSGNTTICGSIQVGIGKKWSKSGNASQCSGYSFTEGSLSLPSVSSFMPSDIATHNSNGRITKCTGSLPAECQQDTYNGNWSSSPPFNPTTRRISLSGNTTLTLGGTDYWICSLSFSGNSKLVMAQGAHARIFFDTPENCGNQSNQISMSGNNEIGATGYQPSLGQFDMPGFYLLGSTTSTSQVSLSGNSSTTNEFVIYAPDSYISVSGNATFKGIIAGRQIAWSGNGSIEQDTGFEPPTELRPAGDGSIVKTIEEAKLKKETDLKNLEDEKKSFFDSLTSQSGARSFSAEAYVECTGGAASTGQAPNSGC